jgi:hypothetical protein
VGETEDRQTGSESETVGHRRARSSLADCLFDTDRESERESRGERADGGGRGRSCRQNRRNDRISERERERKSAEKQRIVGLVRRGRVTERKREIGVSEVKSGSGTPDGLW